MKNSQTFKACDQVPSVNSVFLIENCVLDILVCTCLTIIYFLKKMKKKIESRLLKPVFVQNEYIKEFIGAKR